MSDINIEDLWKNENASAQSYFQSIEEELIKKVKVKSNNVLEQFKRKILFEWIFIGVMMVYIIFKNLDHRYFSFFIVSFVGFSFMTIIPYFNLVKKLRNVTSNDITTCLKSYIEILGSFIKASRIMYIFLMPIGLILGFTAGLTSNEKFQWECLNASIIMVSASILLTIGILGYFFTEKIYIPKMYGKHKLEFEALLENLN